MSTESQTSNTNYLRRLAANTFGRAGLEWGKRFTERYFVSSDPLVRSRAERFFSNFVHLSEVALPLSSRGLVRNAPDYLDSSEDQQNSLSGILKRTVLPLATIGSDAAGVLATAYAINAAQGSGENVIAGVAAGFLAKIGVNAASHVAIDIYERVSQAASARKAAFLTI